MDWPTHLKEFLIDSSSTSSSALQSGAGRNEKESLPEMKKTLFGHSIEELRSLESWAFWRLRIRKETLCLEDAKGHWYTCESMIFHSYLIFIKN